jgi:hypothetical protein
MTELDLMAAISQVGFPIAVSVFLLWKGYTQDKAYMELLTVLKDEVMEIRKQVK